MSTLDDKLLGEKLHLYCSSSEDEDETHLVQPNENTNSIKLKQLPSTNTGPKGVIEDWNRFKKLEEKCRQEREKNRLKLMEKKSITCKSYLDIENENKEKKDENLENLDNLDKLNENDSFLKEYMKKRMLEMLEKTNIAKKTYFTFGKLLHLNDGIDFLKAIEEDVKDVSVICHIYNSKLDSCKEMNDRLSSLAQSYPYVKFCALDSININMSKNFIKKGVPALLVYKNGNLIGNFIRVTDEIGEEIKEANVEAYLIEHGILPDPSLVPDFFT